jgi:hypothetical protein
MAKKAAAKKTAAKRATGKRAAAKAPQVDAELSTLYSKGSKMKACFYNCANLFIFPERTGFPADTALYVEGFVFVHGFPLHHAWVELDGKIIDPTFAILEKKGLGTHHTVFDAKVKLTKMDLCRAYGSEEFPVLDPYKRIRKVMGSSAAKKTAVKKTTAKRAKPKGK